MVKSWLTVKEMTLMAIWIALALVLDRFIVFQQPQGGSINISMVALMLIVMRFGLWKSLFANALVYGFIANLWDGYGLNTYPLDYFLALASLSTFYFMIRFIKSDQLIVRQASLWAGFYIAVSLRLFFHVISGVVLYEVDWVGSWTYNVSYLFPSYVLSAIVLSALIEIKSIQSILFSNQ